MGYYSFYRIIKDIIQTLFNKRILKLILLAIIITIILFILDKNTVSADTQNTIVIDDITFILPQTLSKYIYILKTGGGPSYTLYSCDYPLYRNSSYASTATIVCYSLIYEGNNILNKTAQNCSIYYTQNINNTVDFSNITPDITNGHPYTTNYFVYANYSVYNYTIEDNYYILGDLYFSSNSFSYPQITTPNSDIENFSYNYLYIDPYDYGFTNNLYLHRLEVSQIINSGGTDIYYYGDKTFLLNENTEYYNSGLNGFYAVPYYSLQFGLNKQYYLVLSNSPNPITNTTGIITSDINNGIYEVVSANSTNYLTADDVIISNQNNNNAQTSQTNNTISNIDDFLKDSNFDDENIDESLSNLGNSTNNIDNSQYVGLFNTIFEKFSNLVNGSYNEVEEIHLYLPFVQNNSSIILTSDLLSSHIQNTVLMPIINAFWLFAFGMYIFKFSNNLIIKIKDGSILNGYSNNNEVITSTML